MFDSNSNLCLDFSELEQQGGEIVEITSYDLKIQQNEYRYCLVTSLTKDFQRNWLLNSYKIALSAQQEQS